MRQHVLRFAIAALAVMGVCRDASAQRAFVAVNGGYLAATKDFADSVRSTVYAEEALHRASYRVEPGATWDIGGGASLWRNIGAGVAWTRYSRETPVELESSVPHPFFFSSARTFTGAVTGQREETAIHLQVRARVPVGERVQVSAFGGPTLFRLNQAVVTGVSFSESYPFDSAAFQSAATVKRSATSVGIHIGGEAAYFFSRNVGVGASVLFARGEVEVTGSDATGPVDLGGVHTGFGLRLRF